MANVTRVCATAVGKNPFDDERDKVRREGHMTGARLGERLGAIPSSQGGPPMPVRRTFLTVALSLAAALVVPATSAHAADAGWITACNFSHTSTDDPIVVPRRTGGAHMHDFVGARTTNAFSTFTSLLVGGTTCVMPDDTSAYWAPALFEGGTRLLPTATRFDSLFYYRRKGAPPGTQVQPFPAGLKIIVGNPHATSPAQNPQLGSDIIWKCGPGSTTDLPAPPTQCNSGVMVVSVTFPNCWDGMSLDSADHRSHMAYPVSGQCPRSHPVVLPRLESFFRYPVGPGPIGEISLSSGPWYTIHQDFFNGWRPEALSFLLARCINAGRDCGKNPTVSASSVSVSTVPTPSPLPSTAPPSPSAATVPTPSVSPSSVPAPSPSASSVPA